MTASARADGVKPATRTLGTAGRMEHGEFSPCGAAATRERSVRPARHGRSGPMEKTMLHREDGCGSPRRDADLRVGVLEVVIRGLRGDAEHAGDLLGLQPSGD